MSTKIVCDKCGKETDRSTVYQLTRVNPVNFSMFPTVSNSPVTTSADICPTCYKELIEILREFGLKAY